MIPQANYRYNGRRRMPRKKRALDHDNHDRWLVSYADFITLLFAFFVVMYSISSVNEGKYRVLSDSIVAAFHDPVRSLEPIQVGELQRNPVSSEDQTIIDLFKLPVPTEEDLSPEKKPQQIEDNSELDEAAENLADSIEAAMSDLVDEGLIDVRRDKRWIEVEIKSSILFSSGFAELSPKAIPVLRKLAEKLKSLDNIIHVEGLYR